MPVSLQSIWDTQLWPGVMQLNVSQMGLAQTEGKQAIQKTTPD